ncbi:type VI secretion protein [Escherichia coli]|nr:type VI secretion protein [Escherichia coli]
MSRLRVFLQTGWFIAGLMAGLLNCTPNVGHNLTSEGAVYETFI